MLVSFVLNQIVATECMIIAPAALEFCNSFVLGLFVLNEITLKVSLMITLVTLKFSTRVNPKHMIPLTVFCWSFVFTQVTWISYAFVNCSYVLFQSRLVWSFVVATCATVWQFLVPSCVVAFQGGQSPRLMRTNIAGKRWSLVFVNNRFVPFHVSPVCGFIVTSVTFVSLKLVMNSIYMSL